MMKLVAIVSKCDGSRPISFGGIMHPERRYSPRIKVILNPYTAERREVSDTSRLEAVYGHSFIIIRELLILLLDNRWC